jgi:DNA-binding MarR family transcriptional regulator
MRTPLAKKTTGKEARSSSRKIAAARRATPKESIDKLSLLSDLSYGLLTNLAGFWIRRAQLVVMKSFGQHLSDLNLRPVEAAALVLVGKNKDLSQNFLAAALATDQATMVAICVRLEDRNLISRQRPASDRRYQSLSLTNEGRKLSAIVEKRLQRHNENLLKNLSVAQRKQLMANLHAIVQQ